MNTYRLLIALTAFAAAPLAVAAGTAAKTDATPAKPATASRLAHSPFCLKDTGSLIKPKPGHCAPAVGRSYTRNELLNTGQANTADALQRLDPDISTGH